MNKKTILKKYIANESSIGLALTLTLLFTMLKQTNIISWEWIWVCSPMWIILAFDIMFILIFAIFLRTKR